MKKFVALLAAAILLLTAPCAHASFNAEQQTEIEKIVEKLLTEKNPEIIVAGLTSLQKKKEASEAKKQSETIANNKDKLFNNPDSPVGNNPKGDVNLVEFFDYQCGYCKRVHEPLNGVVQEDKGIRQIYKQFPILGEGSELAAQAAVASISQNKFEAMHKALMNHRGSFDVETIAVIAKDAGLDVDKLKKDMTSDTVKKKVTADRDLGMALGARGTPFFVIGTTAYPGAMEAEQMKKIIADVREAQKKAK